MRQRAGVAPAPSRASPAGARQHRSILAPSPQAASGPMHGAATGWAPAPRLAAPALRPQPAAAPVLPASSTMAVPPSGHRTATATASNISNTITRKHRSRAAGGRWPLVQWQLACRLRCPPYTASWQQVGIPWMMAVHAPQPPCRAGPLLRAHRRSWLQCGLHVTGDRGRRRRPPSPSLPLPLARPRHTRLRSTCRVAAGSEGDARNSG